MRGLTKKSGAIAEATKVWSDLIVCGLKRVAKHEKAVTRGMAKANDCERREPLKYRSRRDELLQSRPLGHDHSRTGTHQRAHIVGGVHRDMAEWL